MEFTELYSYYYQLRILIYRDLSTSPMLNLRDGMPNIGHKTNQLRYRTYCEANGVIRK